MSELPQGWASVFLGELGIWRGGGTPSKSKADYWGGTIPWVSPKDMKTDLITDTEDHITPEAIAHSATQIVPSGSILVVTRSGILRRLLPVALAKRDVAINQDLKALTPHPALDSAFIAKQLRGRSGEILSQCAKSGTTVDSIDFDRLKSFRIAIAPQQEQLRIVTKLDSLFARTRCAREELCRIPRLIEHYKKAILEAAFRGALTKDWRAEYAVSEVTGDTSGIDSRSGDLSPLPPKWSWTSVGALSAISGGLTKNARRRELEMRVPYLRVANVYTDELRLEDVQEMGCTPQELRKTALEPGDLLIVEGNGSIDQIGRVALWDGSIPGCSHQNHLIRARPRESIVPDFLLFWMLSPFGRQYIERVASSSSGLHTLSISKVSGLPVPLCSVEEMREITTRVRERLGDLADLAEETSRAALLLDHLDQAHLAKAFRGELVPQDPNDEPASVLLERIRAERAARPPARRGRRGKTATGQEVMV